MKDVEVKYEALVCVESARFGRAEAVIKNHMIRFSKKEKADEVRVGEVLLIRDIDSALDYEIRIKGKFVALDKTFHFEAV